MSQARGWQALGSRLLLPRQQLQPDHCPTVVCWRLAFLVGRPALKLQSCAVAQTQSFDSPIPELQSPNATLSMAKASHTSKGKPCAPAFGHRQRLADCAEFDAGLTASPGNTSHNSTHEQVSADTANTALSADSPAGMVADQATSWTAAQVHAISGHKIQLESLAEPALMMPAPKALKDFAHSTDPTASSNRPKGPDGNSSLNSTFKQQPQLQCQETGSTQVHQSAPQQTAQDLLDQPLLPPEHQTSWDDDTESVQADNDSDSVCQPGWGSQCLEGNRLFSPKVGWYPDQYQAASAEVDGWGDSFTQDQQHKHNDRVQQHCLRSFGRNHETDSSTQDKFYPKVFLNAEGWHPDQYQGAAAVAYSNDDPRSFQNQRHSFSSHNSSAAALQGRCLPSHDSSDSPLHGHCFSSHNSSALPLHALSRNDAPNYHSKATHSASSSPHALADNSDDPFYDTFGAFPANTPKSSKQSQKASKHHNEHHASRALPLTPRSRGYQFGLQHSCNMASHNRPKIPPILPGGFGLVPSYRANTPLTSSAHSPHHRCQPSSSQWGSPHSSSSSMQSAPRKAPQYAFGLRHSQHSGEDDEDAEDSPDAADLSHDMQHPAMHTGTWLQALLSFQRFVACRVCLLLSCLPCQRLPAFAKMHCYYNEVQMRTAVSQTICLHLLHQHI